MIAQHDRKTHNFSEDLGEAARRSVVFTEQDMTRMVNTWLRVMWNQDEQKPMMASGVDGREPYRFSPLMDGMASWRSGMRR